MFRQIGLVVSLGLADSLNPSTIAVALYLATGDRAKERVFEFTLGVFVVYFVGGAAVALGPGQLLLSLVPHPSHTFKYLIEIAVGAAMLVTAVLLWVYRERLAQREPPQLDPRGKASWVLGASITAVELPTAFPYFAAIAAIVGSGAGPVRSLLLLLLFNVCFVLPLLGIVAVLAFGGNNTDRLLASWRDFLQHRWPQVLSALALVAGIVVIALGVTGLTGSQKHIKQITEQLSDAVKP
jgi:cytochrome c biogenesis protein CcdA